MCKSALGNEFIYSLIRKLPVVGAVFRIINAYAYQGSAECNSRIAPLSAWWSRILKKAAYILFFLEIIALFYNGNIAAIPWIAADAIISVFPSILGFGIGVFALLFVMPESFLVFMVSNRKKMSFGPEIVPVYCIPTSNIHIGTGMGGAE